MLGCFIILLIWFIIFLYFNKLSLKTVIFSVRILVLAWMNRPCCTRWTTRTKTSFFIESMCIVMCITLFLGQITAHFMYSSFIKRQLSILFFIVRLVVQWLQKLIIFSFFVLITCTLRFLKCRKVCVCFWCWNSRCYYSVIVFSETPTIHYCCWVWWITSLVGLFSSSWVLLGIRHCYRL